MIFESLIGDLESSMTEMSLDDGREMGVGGTKSKAVWWPAPLPPAVYRGTSLIRNTHPPEITIGP